MAQAVSGIRDGIGRKIGQLVFRSVFAAVLVAALALSVFNALSELRREKASLENAGFVLAAASADAVHGRDQAKALASLRAVARIPGITAVALSASDGTVIASLGQTSILSREIANASDSPFAFLVQASMPVGVDIVRGGVVAGRLTLIADISHVRGRFFLTLFYTVAAALCAALIGWLVSRPLQRRVTAPLIGLTRQIAEIKTTRNYMSKLAGTAGTGEVAILLDSFNALMGDIRQRDDSLRRLAFSDETTGLPNRAAFIDSLKAQPGPISGAIAMLDLRRFRSLNEAFGQAAGNRLLALAAKRILAGLGAGFAARCGGHEFAVHLPQAKDREEAEQAVQALRLRFAAPLPVGSRGIRVDMDAGIVVIAEASQSGTDAEELLRCAGLALNRARAAALPGLCFFEEDMRTRARIDTELGEDLRQALADNGLEVHFQCILNLGTGGVSGYEALARWCHPKQGYVSPGVFIPLAESHGLIGELGRWVMNESVRQAAEWLRRSGRSRSVSVNVSAAQFLEAGFAEEVEACLKRHALPPGLLTLELTESVFVGAGASTIRENLFVLSRLGVQLALDDFGTGYSSLAYLARLPFSTIKVDRAFVAGADATPRRQALLKSIIGMCHSVGMDVVAEGAETRAEIDMLRSLGADRVQGYVVARPLPAAEAFLAAQAAETAPHPGLTA